MLVVAQSENRTGLLTVADVLALDLIRESRARLVAGAVNADREVRWVHAGEVPDIATFLRGGELLLTAGTGIGTTATQMRRYIDALALVGASALVLELGRAFTEPPEPLCRRADELGFPVAVLELEVSFAEVMRTVHHMIIGRHYQLIESADTIAREFNALLLGGGHVSEVVHKLAELVANPVVVEDASRQVVAYAGTRGFDETVADWPAHSRPGHEIPENEIAGPHQSNSEPPCCFTEVTVRGAAWGRLHVLAVESPINPIDRLALEHASAAIGIALLTDHDNVQRAERARFELFADIARRAPADQSEFLRRARALGADLTDRSLAVIAFDRESSDTTAEHIAPAIQQAAQEAQIAFLAAGHGDRGYLLVGLARRRNNERVLREFSLDVASGFNQDDVTVGVSSLTTVASLPRAFYEADECLRYARLAGVGGVHHFGQLGLHLLLLALADGPELAAFIETELGPVLEFDARGSQQLLPTLRALIESDGNKVRAARALHIERRSVYYRLEKLERVLGRSLRPAETRLGLAVALHALDLAEDRARSARSTSH
jgi:purine catabolism regulator